MAEQPAGPPAALAVSAQLHEIAQLLRTTDHLGPEAQAALAELADDLATALGQGTTPSAEGLAILSHARQLIEALHSDQSADPLTPARRRLEEAAAAVEGRAPYAVAFARRLLDALASLGI